MEFLRPTGTILGLRRAIDDVARQHQVLEAPDLELLDEICLELRPVDRRGPLVLDVQVRQVQDPDPVVGRLRVVWCEKRIDGNGSEIVDMMKVEARLYERDQAAYKTGRGA